MATVTIRNVDEHVKTTLRQRAAAHGRSLEAELRRVLTESAALEPRPRTGAELVQRIRDIVEPVGGIELDIPRRRGAARKPPTLE